MSESKIIESPAESGGSPRRFSHSLFGPILLITVGVLFLLQNLNLLPTANWGLVLRLWPLLLIFLGINIVARQVAPPFGTLLSGLVGAAAVAILAYVLFFGRELPLFNRLGDEAALGVQREAIAFPADSVEAADVHIDFNSAGGELFALEDSPNLIQGEVVYQGELHFDTNLSNGRASVNLSTQSGGDDFFFWLNPARWNDFGDLYAWQLGLNPGVPTDLTLALSSGSTTLDLQGLSLTGLEVDGASGHATISLPPGDYEANYNIGSGSVDMTLPDNGRQTITIDGGSGSLTLVIPAGMEARVEIDGGSGGVDLGGRFEQISGDEADEGVWETADYDDAANRVNIILDQGSASVSVEQ